MKRFFYFSIFPVLLLVGTDSLHAQSDQETKGKVATKNSQEEEEGPMMFKFEPDYIIATEKRRAELTRTKEILDTLDISENKRRKLLRDLYKNTASKRLSKALVADTRFDDSEN